MQNFPVLIELPPAYLKGIGEVAHQYAYIEHVMQLITFDLLGVSPVQGRIAVRNPRPKESYQMICELANTLGITIAQEFDTLGQGLERCQTERDKIVHGIWVKGENETIILRVISGTWQPVKIMRGKEKRLIKPEGVIFNTDHFTKTVALLVATRDTALAFSGQIKEATATILSKI